MKHALALHPAFLHPDLPSSHSRDYSVKLQRRTKGVRDSIRHEISSRRFPENEREREREKEISSAERIADRKDPEKREVQLH
jgi:hypothetical protein